MAYLIGQTQTSFLTVNQDMQLRLIHSVFMTGTSLLRILTKRSTSNEKRDNIGDCNDIFNKALKGFETQEDEKWVTTSYEVPLITDCYGL